jgi:uncharacterized flavoprotein (TIGR03862 family)
MTRLAVIGGGPAGLMAAEVASESGAAVDVYESKGSVGRKFLIAGRGGLNLTHSEERERFVARYGAAREAVATWLHAFDANAVREWARKLGVETFIGTSGRVFPSDMKAAPLLRAWVHRLRSRGVRFHVRHRCVGIDSARTMTFDTPDGAKTIQADAIVLAMGGGSWPQLGSDGAWIGWLRERDVDIADLEPANCGFDVEWTPIFAERFAGHPVKSVKVWAENSEPLQGEFVVTSTGIEGSVIYAIGAQLRDAIRQHGCALVHLDLAPDMSYEQLVEKLSQPRKGRTLTEHLRRTIGIEGVKAGLLYEAISKETLGDARKLGQAIKSLPIKLIRARPLDEAISTAGGIRLSELNDALMIKKWPSVFCAGEMLDWEAPTGGYLLTACFASGRVAGRGAVEWLSEMKPKMPPP